MEENEKPEVIVKKEKPLLTALGKFFSDGVGDEWTLQIAAACVAITVVVYAGAANLDQTLPIASLVIGSMIKFKSNGS